MADIRRWLFYMIIISVVYIIQYINGQRRFGYDDRYTCHCDKGYCDPDTGICNSRRCQKGWYGPSCQKENVAFNKSTWQSSTYVDKYGSRYSRYAVDGVTLHDKEYNYCTHTAGGRTPASWAVDLGRSYPVNDIKIYARDTHISYRFRGFKLFVDELNQKNQHPCRPETNYDSYDKPNGFMVYCNTIGRYITITNDKSGESTNNVFVNLCEVEVYVCSVGTFGSDCTSLCYCQSSGDRCHPVTGHCPNGCANGYTGISCSTNCSKDCETRHCRQPSECNHVDGKCYHEECSAGYQGGDFIQECNQDINYGENCEKLCKDRNCLISTSSCDIKYGKCEGGCQSGWMKEDCRQKCNDGGFLHSQVLYGKYMYGKDCSKDCKSRHCREPSECNHVDGKCHQGCRAGYQGDDCTQECQTGFYGDECNQSCHNRKCRIPNTGCNHITGSCNEDCLPGYKGLDCTRECSNRTYGLGCKLNCADRKCVNITDCDVIDGGCNGLCLEGFELKDCTQKIQAFAVGGTVCIVLVLLLAGIVGVIIIMYRRSNSFARTIQHVFYRQSRKDKTSCEVTTEQVTESCNDRDFNVPENGAGRMYVNNEMPAIDPATVTKYEDSTEDPLSKKVINKKKEKKRPKREKSSPKVCEQQSGFDYYNLQSFIQNKRIDVANLEDVLTKLNSKENAFTDMLQGLTSGFSAAYDDSQIPKNRAKNRYVGYYPYDDNRVKLNEVGNDPHSNYINASYIDSYMQSRFFIAAQGPNKVSINDFIRMIFEANVVKVVMLTNLVESRKNKCERYWPETGREMFGNLELTLDEEIQRANYTTRMISLKHLKSGKEHQTLLFHFTAWADHDVPEVGDLLDFLYRVRGYKADSNSPTLVHCSAGVGRTGTFIAIDSLLKEGEATGSIGVLQFINTMRCQRKGMIQTDKQLKFVYEALVEAFKYGNTSVLEREVISGKSKKFQLTTHCRNKELQFLKEMTNEADKNKIYVPGKPQLEIHTASSWKKSIGYVISDIKGHDMESLWNLIRDQESSVAVVILNDENQVSVYPSSGTTESIGKMTIFSEVEHLPTDEFQMLTVTTYKQERHHVCKMIRLKTGRDYGLESLKDFTELIRLTDQYDSTPHPVTVIYSEMQDAAIFCIMRNILERIKLDKEVEIFNTTRQIQQSLNGVINHKDVYDLIYKMTSELLTSRNIYENL